MRTCVLALAGSAWLIGSSSLIALSCGGTTNVASSGTTTSSAGTGGAMTTGATTTSSTTSPMSSSSGTGGASAETTVVFGGSVVRVPMNVFLSSVQLCIYQHPELPCTETDSEGQFSLNVPANSEVAVTLALAGYAGIVVPIVTSNQDQKGWEIGLPTSASTQGFYGAAPGATYPDPARGFLAVFLNPGNNPQSGLTGAVVSIAPASGEGPIYAGQTFTVADPTLQATSTSGVARFANVGLGVVEVTIGPNTLSCNPNFGGWSAPDPNAVRVPIVAGFETHVGLGCF